jgi:hypothetical protein
MLYFIQPKDHRDSYNPWTHDILDQYGCRPCWGIRPENLSRVFDVYLDSTPRKEALTTILLGINIARLDFLKLFWEDVEKYLKLGKVYAADGTCHQEYVTFTADWRLVIRGGKKSEYAGFCPICGEHHYFPWYPFHILHPIREQALYVPWPKKGLVVNQELFSRIDRKKWKGISIFELPILDESQDGIDALPKDLVIGGKDL